jgi:hypothetical protein
MQHFGRFRSEADIGPPSGAASLARAGRRSAPTIAAIAPGTPIYLDTWRDALAIQVNLTVGAGKCPSK